MAIGGIPDQYIFVHKDDLVYLTNIMRSSIIKCIAVDLSTGRMSTPVIIDELFDVCPYNPITSEIERAQIRQSLLQGFSPDFINLFNQRLEKNKKQ